MDAMTARSSVLLLFEIVLVVIDFQGQVGMMVFEAIRSLIQHSLTVNV